MEGRRFEFMKEKEKLGKKVTLVAIKSILACRSMLLSGVKLYYCH